MARAEWEVEVTEEGLFDVLHHGRPVSYDEEELSDAARQVKRRGGTQYVLIEADGYRSTHRA